MADKEKTQAQEIYELKQQLQVMQGNLEILTDAVVRNDKITKALEKVARVFGEYNGNDNRSALGVMTACWPNIGTIDVMVIDSSYSGGLREAIGIELGHGRNEFMPFLIDEPEEEATTDGELVASES